MKYIDQAMERLKSKNVSSNDDLSLIERILSSESDPNLACILALDLILVGIDTVSTKCHSGLHLIQKKRIKNDI